MTRLFRAVLALLVLLPVAASAQPSFTLLGSYQTGIYEDGGAEIAAYDAASRQLFFVNAAAAQVQALSLLDPSNPTLAFSIDATAYGGSANSVAAFNGLIAVAIEADEKTDPGVVAFFDASGTFLKSVPVGALPDAVTFSPDGRYVIVANEGEPDDDYTIDPEGSVSVIDLQAGVANATVATATFEAFNVGGPRHGELSPQIRIFGPGASVAQDLEPEYPAIDPASQKAYVTLQENNAIAVIDLATASVDALLPLGYKDHSLPGQGLDPSDRDNGSGGAAIKIGTWPVFGMYQPDAVAAFAQHGATYLVTANEGDARDYDGFSEESRVKDLTLDPTAFPNASTLRLDANLGRLNVTTALGDTDGDDDYDALYAYGARSFSVWSTDGALVYDSGDELEQRTAALLPAYFNADHTSNSLDNRSDNKGPEPEAVTVGVIGGVPYAFVGLERIGGVFVYDLSNPAAPSYVTYFTARDFSQTPGPGQGGDLGPESVVFIDAAVSPTGEPLVAVANEVSGTVSFFAVRFPLAAEVTVTPTTPTTVPAEGGLVRYEIALTNTSPLTQTYDVWTVRTRPDGRMSTAKEPQTFTLAPGADTTWTSRRRFAADNQAGSYLLSIHVGTFPDGSVASDVLEVVKAGASARLAASGEVPAETHLVGAYPNPFNPVTTVAFALAEDGPVQVNVYDVLGRQVATLVNEPLSAGTHEVRFDAAALPSGLYLVQFQAAGRTFTQRLTLMK